jgi:hypothetical protein
VAERTRKEAVPSDSDLDLTIGRMDTPRAVRRFLVRVARLVATGDIDGDRAKVLTAVARVVLEAHGLEIAQQRIGELWESLRELKTLRALPMSELRLTARQDAEQASERVVQDVEQAARFESGLVECHRHVINGDSA